MPQPFDMKLSVELELSNSRVKRQADFKRDTKPMTILVLFWKLLRRLTSCFLKLFFFFVDFRNAFDTVPTPDFLDIISHWHLQAPHHSHHVTP